MAMDNRSTNDFYLSLLRCRNCQNFMHPPILKCMRGHSYCRRCIRRMQGCVRCDIRSVTRNASLEEIYHKTLFPCIHDECPFEAKPLALLLHEENCNMKAMDCPFSPATNCKWLGKKKDIIQHCLTAHPLSTFQSDSQNFYFQGFRDRRAVGQVTCETVIEAFGEVFKCVLKIEWCKNIALWCVFNVGGRAHDFKYEIVMVDEKKKLCVLAAPCATYFGKSEMSEDLCLVSHFDTMMKFCRKNGDFIYTVNIIDCRSENDN